MKNEHAKPVSPAPVAGGQTPSGIPPRPPELRLLLPETKTDLRTVFGGAGTAWLVFGFMLFLTVWLRPDQQIQAALPDLLPDLVFLEQPGPGGGGGGGGNKSPEPPKQEKTPAVKPKAPEPIPVPAPDPTPPPPEPIKAEAPLVPTEAPVAVIASAPVTSPSLGTGERDGAGRGSGGGTGPGRGDGIGPGTGGGIGGGAFQVGNGVSSPTVLFTPKPLYTSEAMLRRIQGIVELNCVVEATGSVGNCDIVKSLDSNNFGLDNEALKAAKRFRFKPGTRLGEPVAVLVRIQLEFNMR
jgi:protein TonB